MKPFSANQNTKNKIRVIQETPNAMQAASSTHYTSSFANKPGSVAATHKNFINTQYGQKMMNGTVLSSNDSAEYGKSIGGVERYGAGSPDMVGKESDPKINTVTAGRKVENQG